MKLEEIKIECPSCKGNGYLWENPTGLPAYKCPKCDTKGYIKIIDYKVKYEIRKR